MTMREVAEWYSDGPNASKIIFEGSVEEQEAAVGRVEAPREATSKSTLDRHRVVSLRVLRSYRGEAAGTVRVWTGIGEGDCGFDFDTGSQYLVYADKVEDGTLITSICTGTSLLVHSESAMRATANNRPLTICWMVKLTTKSSRRCGPRPFAAGSLRLTELRSNRLGWT